MKTSLMFSCWAFVDCNTENRLACRVETSTRTRLLSTTRLPYALCSRNLLFRFVLKVRFEQECKIELKHFYKLLVTGKHYGFICSQWRTQWRCLIGHNPPPPNVFLYSIIFSKFILSLIFIGILGVMGVTT